MNAHALEVLEYGRIREILAHYAASGLGQHLAGNLQPLTDLHEIQRRITETTEMKRLLEPERYLPMGGLHDLSPILAQLKQGESVLAIEDIVWVRETLRAFSIVKGFLTDADESYIHLKRLATQIDTFDAISGRIDQTLSETGAVKSDASPELKSIRRTIQTVQGRIRTRLQSVLRSKSVAPYLQDTIVRERKGRLVIAVKERDASRVPGMIRERSDRGNSVFIEPEAIRPLGNELQAAQDAEKAEIVRLLHEITAMIAKEVDPIGETLKILAHLDLTYAKVRFSRDYAMNPPKLDTDGVIDLKTARHPLLLVLQRNATAEQGASIENVVPIDFRLGDDFNTLIITGPNTGGKTVTLKTAGLLTLMAQSGMHIPAEPDSQVAVFSHVAADIGDEQSLEQSLSTFSSHLKNITEILSKASEQSLVLLDELGGGTDPTEGAALGKAILEYLHAKGARTAVTTHISQLKQLGYTVPGMENASVEFDVATLKPTHKLLIGTPGSSNALVIAKRMGLPETVIESAQKSALRNGDETASLINQLQSAKASAIVNKQATEQAQATVQHLEAELRQRLAALETREGEMQTRLRREAFKAFYAIKDKVEQLHRAAVTHPPLLKPLEELREYLGETLQGLPEAQQRTAFIDALKPGDDVQVRRLGQVGKLKAIDSASQKATVQLGAMQMTVTLEELDVA